MKYRTRPREVEAFRWEGQPLLDFPPWAQDPRYVSESGQVLYAYTKSGPVRVEQGDWLILGEREIYPCKDDVFQKNYEPVPIPETTFTGSTG